jgi:lipopolysaccharide/colanic/teichoic acid biosynthesis glycosyltransferase
VLEAKSKSIPWRARTAEAAVSLRRQASLYSAVKRMLDVICSLCLLFLLAPLFAVIALAIRLDSPGPAIFRQRRVGRMGRQFVMFKFRSMHHNADESVHRRFAEGYINGHCSKGARELASQTTVFKPGNDSRITRVGAWLRRTSLDELPQLLNVLRGEMSLVGPRPAMAYEVEQYSKWHLRRLEVLPGLTGLAQISGRSGLTFERIVRLDVRYIEQRCLALDIGILVRTVPVVLKARCAA